jgi:glutamate synthase domain-containing protein 1
MCRLFAVTSEEPISPMKAVEALEIMKEGHDGSGVGLFLTGLSGPFADLPDHPVLSGVFTTEGLRRLDSYMSDRGFQTAYKLPLSHSDTPPPGVSRRDQYVIRAYEPPRGWKQMSQAEREHNMLKVRLDLRTIGVAGEDMIVFSFWPDTIMIKETGDPMSVARYLGLDRPELNANVILAQGRQNTNYAINLYACHPFFIQGFSSMTNGENTAFVPIREFLSAQGIPGYIGYHSDSETFTHILHFTIKRLGLPIEAYKHIISPLQDEDLSNHPDAELLRTLKRSCRSLIIDGPNCVIGCLPDKSLFMVQDRKKLRPGIVGGMPGLFAFSSEVCGLEAVAPNRNKGNDFQPMHLDTAIVSPDRQEVRICRQTSPLPPLR